MTSELDPRTAPIEELVFARRAALAGAPSSEETGTWESSLELHPLFGFCGNRRKRERYNSHGFVMEHEIWASPEGLRIEGIERTETVVVGIFGGSFAGTLRQQSERLSEQLAVACAPRRPLVLNFGFGGHSLPLGLHVFSYFAEVLDVALFVDGVNELVNGVDNYHRGSMPDYGKAIHHQFLVSRNALTPRTFRLTARLARAHSLSRAVTRLSLFPYLREKRAVHRAWIRANDLLAGWARKIEADIVRSIPLKVSHPPRTRSEIIAFVAGRWSRWHRQIAATAALGGIPCLHFLQPSPGYCPARAMPPEDAAFVERSQGVCPTVAEGYPLLVEAGRSLAAEGAPFESLHDVFDPRTEPVWSDVYHAKRDALAPVVDRLASRLGPVIRALRNARD